MFQIFPIPDYPIKALIQPKGSLRAQVSIDLSCRERLPAVEDTLQRIAGFEEGQQMNVVGHDRKPVEMVPNPIKMEQRVDEDLRDFWLTQSTCAVSTIEELIETSEVMRRVLLVVFDRPGERMKL